MANEEDSSSVSEEFDDNLNPQELIDNVLGIATKIRRKKENLEEFVSSMRNENSINKTVLRRFQEIEDDFKEGRKTKSEFKEQQKRLGERIGEVIDKVERLETALEYITSKELQIKELHVEVSKFSEDEKPDDLVKLKYELQSLFSEIKIKFRQSKKVKLSLLTKFKPDDLIQSVKSWEKAAETAREINRRVIELQKEIETKNCTIQKMDDELQEEKERSKEHEFEMSRLADDMKNEDSSKKEQAELISTFRSLLDESEKLARNLEDQNTNLNQIISGEKDRVSELRNKLSDLQDQIENERKSNREMSLQYEHMKAEFLAASAENEGYKRDMEMIRKELDAIRHIQDNVLEIEKGKKDDEDYIEVLEEKLQISDAMLQAKYIETEKLQTDLDKNSERVEGLETKISAMNESITKLMGKLEIKDREVGELTELLRDTQSALESEKLAKDEYIIKCDLLERKLALMDLNLKGNDESDGKINYEEMEKEIEDLREKLEEERLRVAEKISLVEELEEQLIASEEMREYEEDIKTRSIENIVHAEIENRKLMQIVEDLKERLSEKDSGIEELIAHCAVEELKLREEIAGLTNQLQVYKRDCVYKANIIERLRRKIESQRSGLGILNENDEEETETDLLVKTAALERKLHEERIKIMKYEQALIELNKLYEEKKSTIREKDYELSQKSAEDGKRIAELLQELESDKKSILELDEQIENLEDILSLKEAIENLENDSEDGNYAELEKELQEMKEDYAAKKIRRKDELIDEMRQFIENLKNELNEEQDRIRKHEDLISDLNDANVQDLKKIDQLQNKIQKLEQETSSQRDYIDNLTDKITEGQRLISELEGVADRERMRVATIEQLLVQDQQDYSKHLDSVRDLKQKVDNYQSNVGELRTKVDRIHRNITTSPKRKLEPSSGPITDLKGKINAQKTIIRELKANVSAVEEKNEELDAELKEQKGKNIEQDEKIDQLLIKTLECEDLVKFMKVELELVRKRYRGLSGLSEEDTPEEASEAVRLEEIRQAREDLQAEPSMSLFSYLDDEKENEGDDELEEGESDTIYSSEDQEEKTQPCRPKEEQETRHKELIHQLIIFEKVFEKIFSEEGKRIDIVIGKFESVMQKNTELLANLQNVRQTLSEARNDKERKEDQIEQMKEEFLSLKDELDETKSNNEKIKKDLEEEEERTLQLSDVLTDEQVKGIASQEKATIIEKILEDQQHRIDVIERKLEEEMMHANQLRASLSVEQLIKLEYEREIMVLKSKVMEEQEVSESVREELERETTARYEFEERMKDLEEEAYNRANIIDELQKDFETERRCYSIVTERLQAEQEKLVDIESYVKGADKSASDDRVLIEELRESIAKEEEQKKEFLNKLRKFEKDNSVKDNDIDNLMKQLGSEKNKMEELIGEIDLEKMAKSTAVAKLQELEEHLGRDEQIFDDLRRNIDSERAKNRELSELLDNEQERNAEIEEKARELEKQVLMDLELFDELKNTIEQERVHNRELDALLNEKTSCFNNRDKLLSELDSELSELKAVVKKEQLRNEDLNEELKKRFANENVIVDLQDMLKSQIMHSEEVHKKAEKLEEMNREQGEKMEVLEGALKRLKELSAQISKELTDDLQAWGEPVEDPEITDADFPDLNDNYDYSAERDALRFKALLNNELAIKKNLMSNVEDYKNKLDENDVLLSELNEILKAEQNRVKEIEEAANNERKQKEETQNVMRNIETELKLKRKVAEDYKTKLNENDVLLSELNEVLKAEQNRVKEIEEAANNERKDKEEAKSIMRNIETELELKRKVAEDYKTKLDENDVLLSELNEVLKAEQNRVKEIEEAANNERKQKEETQNVMRNIETELELKRKDAEDYKTKLDKNDVLLSELNGILKAEQNRVKEIEEAANNDRKDKEEAKSIMRNIETELELKRKVAEDYKTKLDENDVLLSELNEVLKAEQKRVKEIEEAANNERKQNEETQNAMRNIETELELKRKDAEDYKTKLDKNDVLLSELNEVLKAEQKRVKEIEEAAKYERKQKEETQNAMRNIETKLELKRKDAEDYKTKLDKNDVLLSELNGILKAEQNRVKEIEEAANNDRKDKEEAKSIMRDIENQLELKQQDAVTSRADLDKLKSLYDEKVAENDQKVEEARMLATQLEDQEGKEQKFFKELEENIEKMDNLLKEKEEESEMLRNYFEEEHKFAKDRLEQNQELKKQLDEMETKLKDNEAEITKLLNEKTELNFSLQKTNSRFEKQREILVEEIKDKTKKNNANVHYIKELQKDVEELSLSHRRSKDQIIKPTEKRKPHQDTKVHLKEIEDEFDSLDLELKQKDEEIAKLQKALHENNVNPQQKSELQKEVEHLKLLAQEHAERAQKAVSALKKARLLRELLQTERDVKELIMNQRSSNVNSSTPQSTLSDSTGVLLGYSFKRKEKEELTHKEESVPLTSLAPSDIVDGKKDVEASKEKEEETGKLKEQLTSVTAAMNKNKEVNERLLNEKNKEIEQQAKTIALIKNLYQVLKYEGKREKVLLDVMPTQDAALEDARILFKDLENQLQLLQDEVASKAETIKDLKLYINELKTNKDIDMSLLDRKENVYRLLSVQLKEKEKKLNRMEGLLQNIEKIYGKKVTEDTEEQVAEETGRSVLQTDNNDEIGVQEEEGRGNTEDIVQVTTSESLECSIPQQFEQGKNENQDATDSPLVFPSKTTHKDDETSSSLDPASPSQNKDKAIDDQNLPKSGWKVKLLLYFAIAVGLSFLPQYLKLKTLRLVLVFVVTPLFFVLSTVEVKFYRKKVEDFVKQQLDFEKHGNKALVLSGKTKPLLDEYMKIKIEEEEKLFLSVQDQLRQELQTYLSKKDDPQGKDEVDDLAKQKRKVDDLEKKVRGFEQIKIEEQEKNRKSHDEYIKLRNDVDELKQRRDVDTKLGSLDVKKHDTSRLDSDVSLLSLRARSLPLWIAFSVGIYHVTSLHPAAPCAVFLLLSLYAVNSWFKIKVIKKKLLNEREITREQNEELEDLTELLEKEQNVVESQKVAMQILVKEIDNEYVSRKAKSLTLAKMILQVKELEEMRRAIHEENLPEKGDLELKSAMKSVSEEKAEERVRMYVEMSRKLPELKPGNPEGIEDIHETVEEIAAQAQSVETGNEPKGIRALRSNPKTKLVVMAILGGLAFVASLFFTYYFPAILTAVQLVIIFQWLIKRSLQQQDDQYPSNMDELQTRLDKEIQKNKANRQQIGKLKRLLDTENSFKKSDECAKEIKRRVMNRAKQKQV